MNKTVVDFIKDDPCYGCQYAVAVPDHLLASMFSRRTGCASGKARDWLVGKAREALGDGPGVGSESVARAAKYLCMARDADEFFQTHGFYECVDASVGHPGCFFGKEEEENG